MARSPATARPAGGAEAAPPPLPFFGRGGPGGPGSGPQMGLPKVRAKNTRGTVWRLWGYLQRQRWSLVLTIALVVATTGVGLLGPFLLGVAIDRYIIPGDLPGLARLLALMLAVYVVGAALTWLQSY